MRYWVYLNDKVMEKPFEEGELSSVPGFNADTLVCKETPAPGETQEWLPAKMVIEAYKRPVPPPPPPPQILSKFAPQQNTEAEPKVTVFSGNIFGSSSDNNEISIGGQTPYTYPPATCSVQGSVHRDVHRHISHG